MKADLPKDNDGSPLHEEKDPLWDLLGRAPMAVPDGWFAARTLARCRSLDTESEVSRPTYYNFFRWALGMGLASAVALLAITRLQTQEPEVSTHDRNVQEAFQIMASMGDDSNADPSASTTASWPDSSL